MDVSSPNPNSLGIRERCVIVSAGASFESEECSAVRGCSEVRRLLTAG